MEPRRFYVISGGTMVHVAPHFALCAPAYGSVGWKITDVLRAYTGDGVVESVRTRMACGIQGHNAHEKHLLKQAGLKHLETNEDLSKLVDYLIEQPETRCIVMASAVCDWDPLSMIHNGGTSTEFGKDQPRLRSRGDCGVSMNLKASDKIIKKIRERRKDIFLVAFKATAGFEAQDTYSAGLRLLKQTSANLVFANDVRNHTNVIVTPEEFPYWADNRKGGIRTLARLIGARTQLDFVRTEVVENEKASINEFHEKGIIPQNFVPVLRHLINSGAFKPFLGKTAGHFGCKVESQDHYPALRLSSVRKVNHNNVFEEGMARVYGYLNGKIQAGGAKPSVGEHTQHQIYERLGDKVHSIVHFHCPRKDDPMIPEGKIPLASQQPFECGSVQCGENTANNMKEVARNIWAVHLEGHGPNIAFHKDEPAEHVINVIEQGWHLGSKSGGPVKEDV